jgi:hypothetical protein
VFRRKVLRAALGLYTLFMTGVLLLHAPWERPFTGVKGVTELDPAPVWDRYYLSHGAHVEWTLVAMIWFGLVGVPIMLYVVWCRESANKSPRPPTES